MILNFFLRFYWNVLFHIRHAPFREGAILQPKYGKEDWSLKNIEFLWNIASHFGMLADRAGPGRIFSFSNRTGEPGGGRGGRVLSLYCWTFWRWFLKRAIYQRKWKKWGKTLEPSFFSKENWEKSETSETLIIQRKNGRDTRATFSFLDLATFNLQK